jgi:hypothetical protein
VNVTRADRLGLRQSCWIATRRRSTFGANIILATADGCGTAEIMHRSGKSKPVIWRWQARFMAEDVEGLTRDKTRTPGKQPPTTDTVQRVVDLAFGLARPVLPRIANQTLTPSIAAGGRANQRACAASGFDLGANSAEGDCDALASVSTMFSICSRSSPSMRMDGITVPVANLVGSVRNCSRRALVQIPCLARSPGE